MGGNSSENRIRHPRGSGGRGPPLSGSGTVHSSGIPAGLGGDQAVQLRQLPRVLENGPVSRRWRVQGRRLGRGVPAGGEGAGRGPAAESEGAQGNQHGGTGSTLEKVLHPERSRRVGPGRALAAPGLHGDLLSGWPGLGTSRHAGNYRPDGRHRNRGRAGPATHPSGRPHGEAGGGGGCRGKARLFWLCAPRSLRQFRRLRGYSGGNLAASNL